MDFFFLFTMVSKEVSIIFFLILELYQSLKFRYQENFEIRIVSLQSTQLPHHHPLSVNLSLSIKTFSTTMLAIVEQVEYMKGISTALSYHMPLSIIDGFSSTGDLECVLVFELDFNSTTS